MNYRLMFSENKYEIYVDEGSLYDWLSYFIKYRLSGVRPEQRKDPVPNDSRRQALCTMGREEREPRATTVTRCGTCELRATWEKEKKMYIPGPKIMYVNLVLLGYVPSRMKIILFDAMFDTYLH